MSLEPAKVVASFDSASVFHAATAAGLRRASFPHLGKSGALGVLARVAGRLPWPVLKRVYARIGGAEGIDPDSLGEVDLQRVAAAFAGGFAHARYPAAFVGSSNGALTHLATAMQVPWLPVTVLIPVKRVADPARADLALEFGRKVAPPLLKRNPEIVLHQMHDNAQDELMVARMSYFRVKFRGLPRAYASFLGDSLQPGAPVFAIDDISDWPVTRVSERHVFQSGGRGGLTPEQYLARPHTPSADDRAPEAEWGADPLFIEHLGEWCETNGHPLVRLTFAGPQAAAAPVADTIRAWTRRRGGAGDRLLVPSFVLGDPWRTVELGDVPFWAYFPVQPALHSLRDYLATRPYTNVDVLLFEHGADSPGIARPEEWEHVIARSGARPRILALRREAFPHDIGSLGRYGPMLAREPEADLPFVALSPEDAIAGLAPLQSETTP